MNSIKIFASIIITIFFFGANQAQSPGNHSNLSLWLKADQGVTGNAPVTAWSDQSSLNQHPIINGDPTLQQGNFNYNPTIDLDGTGDFFEWPNLITDANEGEIFTVHSIPSSTSTVIRELWDWDNMSTAGSSYPYTNGIFYDDFGRTGMSSTTIGNLFLSYTDVTKQYIYNNSGDATGISNYIQGNLNVTSGVGFSAHDVNVTIGKGDFSTISTQPLISETGEIVYFNQKLSITDRRKVWTYLAVKYGITLQNIGGGTNGDYLATNGNLVWDASDNPSYHNEVVGIARDDDESLLQKQSHTFDDSTRVYLQSISPRNQLNTGVFVQNNSYVMLGDNRGKTCAAAASNSEMPVGCGLFSRLEREWKVQTTNTVNQLFNVDIKLNACAATSFVTVSELRLLVDDDGDFSNGGTSCYYNGDGTDITISFTAGTVTISNISNIHMPDGTASYFTIGSISNNTPLPVELMYFEGRCEQNNIELIWSTSYELNNSYYTIERSFDGIVFEVVGMVVASGNSSSNINYTYTDENPFKSDAHYRLRQTDHNGDYDYIGGIIKVSCDEQKDVSVYPNPFESGIFIEFSEETSFPIEIELLDYLGRRVYFQKVIESKTFITLNENLPTGTYLIILSNSDLVKIEKLIKIK